MPRFRTGTKVKLNVYDGDRPIFQAHSEESAAELVRLLNLGLASEGRLAEFHKPRFVNAREVDPRGLHCPVCGQDRTPGADGMQTYTCNRCGTLALPVPDTSPSAPESPSEPPVAPGVPGNEETARGPGASEAALSYIRASYQVPARRDRRVAVEGREGVIVGGRDAHLLVQFPDEEGPLPCHPTWKVQYYVEPPT